MRAQRRRWYSSIAPFWGTETAAWFQMEMSATKKLEGWLECSMNYKLYVLCIYIYLIGLHRYLHHKTIVVGAVKHDYGDVFFCPRTCGFKRWLVGWWKKSAMWFIDSFLSNSGNIYILYIYYTYTIHILYIYVWYTRLRHDVFRFQGTSHGIPLLLGPGTEAFRNAAAQVANDYQRPMILWSIPQEPISGGFLVERSGSRTGKSLKNG